MLGRRGHFLEEKGLTVVYRRRIYEQDAWMTAAGGCFASHAYDDSWPHFSFFGMFVTHRQKCHAYVGLQRVLAVSRGFGMGLSRSGFRTRWVWTRQPMLTWDEFNSWTG